MKTLLSVLFVLFCAYGWIMNIVTLWGTEETILAIEPILRIVGIFVAPLGIVLGYV